MGSLDVGDGGQRGRDAILRRLRLANDLEADDRGVIVAADLAPGVERRVHVGHVRRLREAANELGDDRAEGGIRCKLVAPLDQDGFTCRLLEARAGECLGRAPGLAVPGVRLRKDVRADRIADEEGDGNEAEPAEGRRLPVRGAPAASASGEVRSCAGHRLSFRVPGVLAPEDRHDLLWQKARVRSRK